MNIQGISSSAQVSSGQNKVLAMTDRNHEGKQETLNISLQKNNQKFLEGIQEQIQQVRDNDAYDEETKKAKISELEKMMAEAQETMALEAAQEAAEAQKKKIKEEAEKAAQAEERKALYENKDGDTFEMSKQVELLMKSGLDLNNVRDTYRTKVILEARQRVMQAEQKADNSRTGARQDTLAAEGNAEHAPRITRGGYKNTEIAELGGAISAADKAFTDALKSANTTAKELSETSPPSNHIKDKEEDDDNAQKPSGEEQEREDGGDVGGISS